MQLATSHAHVKVKKNFLIRTDEQFAITFIHQNHIIKYVPAINLFDSLFCSVFIENILTAC